MAGHGEKLVSVNGVFKSYKGFPVLLDLSFDIPKGSIFGYIGPNGAGKTTTIKIMIGLIRDYMGNVTIDGQSVRNWDAKMSSKIGYLPQQTSLQDWRTVDQALRTFGRLSGLQPAEADSRIKEVTETLGITEYRSRKVGKLSGGTLQKVGMAQAMLHRPELLVLDEPVAGLDPESRVLFRNLFRKLSRDGTTIFFSSHILSDIEDIADTIGIIGQGRMRYAGSMDELREKVGRNTEIHLETVESMPNASFLESMPSVAKVDQVNGTRFHITLHDPKEVDSTVDQVIRVLLADGKHIRGIYPSRQTLESLYLRYTDTGGSA